MTDELLETLTAGQMAQIVVGNDKVMQDIEALKTQFDESIARLQARFENKVEKLQRGDDLPPGVMKMIKIGRAHV